MKWAYSVKSKITLAALLFGVMCLVIFTNFEEQNDSNKINHAVSSMYKDRLIVESYIFNYSQNLQNIVEIVDDSQLATAQKQASIKPLLHETIKLNDAYKSTELTKNEALYFNTFVEICQKIDQSNQIADFNTVKKSAKEAMYTLQVLSDIQLSEAKLQMSNIDQLFGSSAIYSQFEMAVLIIIGIIIVSLVLASKSLTFKSLPHNSNWN